MSMLVIGYFRRGSLGDDLMLDGLSHTITRVLGAESIDAMALPNPRRPSAIIDIARLVVAACGADAVVLSGGTLLRDSRGRRDVRVLVFMTILTWLLAVASRRRLLVMGAGIGPLDSRLGRALAKAILMGCSHVVARDDASYVLGVDLAGRRTSMTQGADLAFLAPLVIDTPAEQTRKERRVAVSLVGETHGEIDPDPIALARWLATQVRALEASGVDLLAFAATDAADDLSLAEAVAAQLTLLGIDADTYATTESLAALRLCSVAVVARYHALVCAALTGLPVICLPYEDKVDQLRRQLGISDAATTQYWDLANGANSPGPLVPELASTERIAELQQLSRRVEWQLAGALDRPRPQGAEPWEAPNTIPGGTP